MKNIFNNPYAFVALIEDGSAIEWGDQKYGGNAGQKLNGKKVILYYFEIPIERIFKFFHKR